MNKRLWQALISVSSVSVEAKQLATDLLTDMNPETVRKLYAKNAELQAKIAELSGTVEPEISVDELDALSTQFSGHLTKVEQPDLVNYNRQYLAQYPKQVRYVLAVALRNRAVQLGITPLDEWLDVISLGGELA